MSLHEECGVFGIFGHPEAAQITYLGLVALQHRGQEAAGIASVEVTNDGTRRMHSHRGLGLLSDVFRGGQLQGLVGSAAIGHVRYSTAGSNTIQNAQPITVSTHRRNLAIAHNGNLVNAHELRIELERQGSLFQSTSDTEVIAHLVAKSKGETLLENVQDCVKTISGGFALLFLSDDELIAVRDPHGLRPLAIGKLGDAYVLASESCAFETIGAEFLRNIEPGEIIVVNSEGMRSIPPTAKEPKAMCTFEHIYFARPDSDIDGWNVHSIRKQLGRILAKHHPAEGDIVIGVPDSSISAAAGFAEESGIPLEMGLVKNKYIARTFIQPSQEMREGGVRLKLNAVRSVVAGKRVILIDDSIVRGTTSRRIVQLLRDAGAKEVHVRISSPPYKYSCHYGIDTSSKGQLIAAMHSEEEICEKITADSLAYLTLDEMMSAFGFRPGERAPFCNACFTGCYPTKVSNVSKTEMECVHH
jgi:amidophosphoribosyltransferase